MHPLSLRQCLHYRVTIRLASQNLDTLLIVNEFGLSRFGFAPRLRLDRIDPGGPNEDMIDVEVVANEVMKHPIALLSEAFEILPNRSLALRRLPQGAESRQEASNFEDCDAHHDRSDTGE